MNEQFMTGLRINVGVLAVLMTLALVVLQSCIFSSTNLSANHETLWDSPAFVVVVSIIILVQTVMLLLVGECLFWQMPFARLACFTIAVSVLLSVLRFIFWSAIAWYETVSNEA